MSLDIYNMLKKLEFKLVTSNESRGKVKQTLHNAAKGKKYIQRKPKTEYNHGRFP